ncbi:MAG TPA: SMI1/KNR4 family protein [Tepidisphaeraceae bacterium]|jgi:hypothetical protein|nr:SMI1/KNR4 family protein [Tepidisphaeraceae bacterium]
MSPDLVPIADTLARLGSDWKAFEPPLPADEIDEACRLIGRALPARLVELYHTCNRGEGSLPFQPWNFVLWGVEEVVEMREDEHYRKYYDHFVFFGSSGGGEYFGLDASSRVFIMDPVAGEESNIVVAESFAQFAEQIGFEPAGGLPISDEI